ncbi:alpha/beta hydrolase family protein [Bacillus alkalisoli]|uniref:alpha/beta hydrolase family protein n=1 Tax=Bacillus alkalisoli TaxID=2011008 RepID=UPI000C2458FD|nr:hypothetical protein [Bacillus alkalisoli]
MNFNEFSQRWHNRLLSRKNNIRAIILFYIFFFITFMSFYLTIGVGKWFDVLFIVLTALLTTFVAYYGFYFIIWIFKSFPNYFLALLAAVTLTSYVVSLFLGPFFAYIAYGIIGISGLTAVIFYLLRNIQLNIFVKCAIGLFVFSIHILGIWIVANPGTEGQWNNTNIKEKGEYNQLLDSGPYNVQAFTYGSGDDKQRSEYQDGITYQSDKVNIRSFTVQPKGLNKKFREWFWGFDFSKVPLNGRVWMPESQIERLPLVLIVHGNHNMVKFSDEGYQYLAEHLASNGYIAVSVDENFLNSSKLGHVGWDNAARALVLLKHLEQWEKWNNDKDHELYNKVDFEKIALIGHSRGGEAVSLAALFNELTLFPNNARVSLDFNFNIKSIIGLSPGDRRFQPGGKPTELQNINYLTLQGSNDTDHTTFNGMRQYEKVSFSDDFDGFKSSIYIYGGNHGQFNTSWETDRTAPYSWIVNRTEVIDPNMQRRITQFYILSFLEATLNDKQEFRGYFSNKQSALSNIPTDILRIRYEDSTFLPIATFEEDVDVTTTTIDGGEIIGTGMRVWREAAILLRNSEPQENQAVKLGWQQSNARYVVKLPIEALVNANSDTVLRFDAIQLHEEKYRQFGVPLKEEVKNEAIPITVALRPSGVQRHDSRIATNIWIEPTYSSNLYKWNWWNNLLGNKYEHVLQTYEIPLSTIIDSFKSKNYDDIVEIEFQFNHGNNGLIYLDQIGFSQK